MNMAQAHRCSGCGAEFGLIVESEIGDSQCSDCHVPLEAMRETAGTLLACPKCGGQFVEHALLRSLLQQYETTGVAFPDAPYHKPAPKAVVERVHYRPCCVCGQMMNRKNFGGSSGVIVDVCTKHGTWFDAGELPQVFAFVQSGGLVRERVREEERKRQALARDRQPPLSSHGSLPHSFDSSSLSGDSSSPSHFAADLLSFVVDVLKLH